LVGAWVGGEVIAVGGGPYEMVDEEVGIGGGVPLETGTEVGSDIIKISTPLVGVDVKACTGFVVGCFVVIDRSS
jgi:hypothetical protein